MTRVHHLLAVSTVAALLSGAVLSGCSGDSGGQVPNSDESVSVSPTPSAPTASASETPYLPVPDGIELTAQGTELKVGQRAVVAFEPRQNRVGVLDVRITRLEKTSFKESFVGWTLDAVTRSSNPYFVHATVTNAGSTELGGRRTPLYIVDGNNTLIEASSFAGAFKPCASTPLLPKKFGHGEKAKLCLVFLAPKQGKLTAVSFRPTQEFDPITWTGEIKKPKKPKKHSKPR